MTAPAHGVSRPSRSARASAPSPSPPQASDPARTLVVGIGASADGLEAIRDFLGPVPPDGDMTFILVPHQDPAQPGTLVDSLRDVTAMPVHLATDGMLAEPNAVYVIPPDAVMTLTHRRLLLARPPTVAARRTIVDTLLTSLAGDAGEDAVGIVLSGTDGAQGIAAIKEAGGLTLSRAGFDAGSTAGGCVDHVLQPAEMLAVLLDHRRHRRATPTEPDAALSAALPEICAILHSRLGRDFSCYKPGTLLRRIQRRMNVLPIRDPGGYLQRLDTDPHEAELLFHEMLIGVTRFFRDPAVFDALAMTAIGPMLAETGRTDPLRIWVAGCSSGEEAYSVAILLRESMARTGSRRPVQLFGTDIDDRAIGVARAGVYPRTIAADMTQARLVQNFVEEDGQYRVNKALREMCLFSVHDLLSDPPFSRLDLITCRNLLIYFEPELQGRVLATFHYALRPGRHLLLGPAEGTTAQSRLFGPVDKKNRIHVRREGSARLPSFPQARALRDGTGAAAPRGDAGGGDVERRAMRVLANHAPAFLVVNGAEEVLHFSGSTAGLLQPPTGQASLNLFALLHADLQAPVRVALRQAIETGARVRQDGVPLDANGRRRVVAVIVERIPGPEDEGLFVIAFGDQGVRPVLPPVAAAPDATPAMAAELATARERLRSALHALDGMTEELRSSNDEYLSVNEELQSANEELETSKEELQSLNEELQTINAELNGRNDSLVRSNSDLANLFDSTSVATLFLDNELRIRRFTPGLLNLFRLREGDEGRPITDIVSHLSEDGLGRDVREAMRTLCPVEREVTVPERGMSYLMQVRPYRDLNDVADGAVVTFVDITDRKRAEETRSRLAAIVESSQDAIFSQDRDGTVTSWNAGAAELFGYSGEEIIGQPAALLLLDGTTEDRLATLLRLEKGERIERGDTSRRAKDGRAVDVSITISAVRGRDAFVEGASVIARDIGQRRRAEQKAELLMGELHHRVKNVLAIVGIMVSQTLRHSTDAAAFAEDLQGRIQAMANAHDLLGTAGEASVPLEALVQLEMAPYRGHRAATVAGGPDVALSSNVGLAVAMAVHELAANAAKHGAMSVPDGRLSVSWSTTPGRDGFVTLVWTETGGPPVQPPTRRGFGSTLIERVLANEAGAEVKREFLPAGVCCTITIPATAGEAPTDAQRKA